MFIFLSILIKTLQLHLQVKPLTQVSTSKMQVFLMKFVSKEVKNLTLLPPFWTVFSIQVVILSKRLLTSFLTTTLGYGCIWTVVLILAKHAPHSKNDISEDSEVNNCFEKYILLALWRMQSRLQVFLLPSKFESDWITSHENSLPSTVSKCRILGFFGGDCL